MRRFVLFVLTLAAMSCAPAAFAAEPQRATAQQMSELAGHYQLSDGRRLEIDFDGSQVFARIDKRAWRQLDSSADGRFKTADGALVVRLASDATGTPKVAVMLHDQSTGLPRGQVLALR